MKLDVTPVRQKRKESESLYFRHEKGANYQVRLTLVKKSSFQQCNEKKKTTRKPPVIRQWIPKSGTFKIVKTVFL